DARNVKILDRAGGLNAVVGVSRHGLVTEKVVLEAAGGCRHCQSPAGDSAFTQPACHAGWHEIRPEKRERRSAGSGFQRGLRPAREPAPSRFALRRAKAPTKNPWREPVWPRGC